MDKSFTFKLDTPPKSYIPVEYLFDDDLSLSIDYNKKSWDTDYKINSIIINKKLSPNTKVPTAIGAAGPRGLITSKSLQISFANIKMTGNCINAYGIKTLPQISLGDEATFEVKGLDDDGTVNMRITSCSLKIGTSTYTLSPTRYVDNRISDATCDFGRSGGKRKRRVTKKARRNRRRYSRRK
jgi:hypothetical protein